MANVKIVNASKSYGPTRVLQDINLDIADGEFVVFVGPSGCGKSTLLRMISGLEEITSGEIRLDDRRVNNVDPAKRGVAMVFQSYALYPHMTVFQNMAFSLTMAHESKAKIAAKVNHAAEILRVTDLLDRRPGQLSGGQKQRVAIGRAIVREPQVFLFDEPLSNLDAELRVQMRAELIELHAKLGTTMIFVTHDQVEAMTLADRMVVMNQGVIQQVGRPLDLYEKPANRFVAGFVGSPKMNFIGARLKAAGDETITLANVGGQAGFDIPWSGPALPGGDVDVGIRSEHIAMVETTDDAAVLSGRVAFVEELGDVTFVHFDLPSGERLIARSAKGRYAGGAPCLAKLDRNAIHLFDKAGVRVDHA